MASRKFIQAALLLPLMVTALPTNSGPTVTIDSGTIVGLTTQVPTAPDVDVNKFLGIPYANPPVRFSPPQLATPWTTPIEATAFGPSCVQQFPYPEASRNQTIAFFNTPPVPESEDCLTLNVFAPANASSNSSSHHDGHDWSGNNTASTNNSKAVMFWIYGGSLRFGSSRTPQYDGSYLAAEQDVVVVTINYRTNIFGFPGADTLPTGEQNLGFLDQRFALSWVQRNIAHFGGDPSKVTIFGESAGAVSVDALITQPPPEKPLPFRAAILQSGTASVRTSVPDYSASWTNASLALDCPTSPAADNLACMRAVPAPVMKDKIERLALSFPPVPDNVTFASNPRRQRARSTPSNPLIARVPILIGSNADEGRLFSIGVPSLSLYLAATFPNAATDPVQARLVALLNATYSATGRTAFEQVANLITDSTFQCPAALVARETAVNASVPAYRYYYNASFPNTQLFPNAGVYHASEIPSVFGTYPTTDPEPTEWQEEVAGGVMEIWAGFAKDPTKGVGLVAPEWGTFPELGVLGGGVRAEDGQNGRGNGKVVEVKDPRDVDVRCWIWEAVYAARSGGG